MLISGVCMYARLYVSAFESGKVCKFLWKLCHGVEVKYWEVIEIVQTEIHGCNCVSNLLLLMLNLCYPIQFSERPCMVDPSVSPTV